ncbi:NAD(P)-dependent dehydrogenase, short-chain alcohol dehydrogenase family [Maribacter sedimenticola]|uniref:NAD(P)-dependent dehydrogenase, short-chain alcohol dehydrogenase family n=1 Tax=Maribacter sedimenticola TaxID=228956 RepID=A0ABY1SIP6_9FLAO|nr:SDR family oxidoreductase [Maribacter sedimenticola]SNR55052.1 NAD(P)-dependent dehydrogenase, short-chain alcohol dehydrogenase family [Maribacter sedimenticola]
MGHKLEHKVAIVTGATSGMGKAIARSFVANGASVVLSGRNIERGKKLAKELGDQALFLNGDVSIGTYNEQLVRLAVERFGRLDILSLNAGILGIGSVTDLEEHVWNTTLHTNLSSIFLLSKYAIPELQKQPGSSILINASIAAYKSFPQHPAYCASKAGSLALMRQMAVEYAPSIRVNAMCPGPVDTPLLHDSAKAFNDPSKAVENAGKSTLLNRLGKASDVANLALFLVSEDASWITGSAMTIDGGKINT